MRLVGADTKEDLRKYIRFAQTIYKGNQYYRDSLSPILSGVLSGKSAFCAGAQITPVLVMDGGNVVAVCTYIVAHKMHNTVQIAFFEAEEGCREAVDLIVECARKECRERNIGRITIGLNGHVNFGLGLLSDHFNTDVCFGCSYNPPYYIDYFSAYGGKEYNLNSYCWDLSQISFEREKRVIERIARGITIREADFGNLRREARIFSELNNRCFSGQPFYSERTTEEDYELMDQFRLFIKGENLLIAEKKGDPLGFLLWYPDFNQLIPPGKGMGLRTLVKNKLWGRNIDRLRISEIAIVPEYQGSGLAVALLGKCFEIARGRYCRGESGWILGDNIKSNRLVGRYASEYKNYKAWELNV